MTVFLDEYSKLIAKQYYSKPKARAEIELKIKQYEKLYNIIDQFPKEFDIDNAYGDRLDKIGKIVGVDRNVNFIIDKIGFGFEGNPNARGFGSIFNNNSISAPFTSLFTPQYTPLQLDDNDYRQFIKIKIAVNNASAYLISDDRISIQDIIIEAFEGRAWVIDNYNMKLTLYVSPFYELERLRLVLELNLLPKPQAVGYNIIINAEPKNTFGFTNNSNALGFGSIFQQDNGYFANLVTL